MAVKISQLLPRPQTIETGNGSFDVYGVTTEDLITLLDRHKLDFARFFALGEAETPDYSLLLSTAPSMVADVIAAGARVKDLEEIEAIKQLPFGVQLAALTSIWTMTVPDPKKLRPLLLGVLQSIKKAAAEADAAKSTEASPPVKESS